jgi:hypothetical protein
MDGCFQAEMGWLMSYSISYMQVVYFVILIVAGIMEFSPRFDTKNFIKKIALMLIILGSLIHLAKRDQPLAEFGIALYLMVELVGSYCYATFERRQPKIERGTDRRATQ